eukprot:s926_g5.t1
MPTILLGDCNAHVGSVDGRAIGSLHADIENRSGTLLRQLCERFDLVIPSTFEQFHVGSGNTYRGPRGHCSRIDFIALSAQCIPGIKQSFVDDEIDLLNGDKDHFTLCLDLQMVFTRGCEGQKMLRTSLYDRNAARQTKRTKQVDLSILLPEQSWDIDVNKHWNAFRISLQEQSVSLFPKAKRQQRQLYFDSHTWQALCDRKDLRQQHRALCRDWKLSLLTACFATWKHTEGTSASDHRYELHQCRLQEAVLLEARRCMDQNFRQAKKKAWKEWTAMQLNQSFEKLNRSKTENLYQLLQPKRAIARAQGKLLKPLPGLKDGEGQWRTTRKDVAAAWQAQFSQTENAEPVSFASLVERSANPAAMARRLYSLFIKSALRGQGITELAGGWLLALYKGKGNPKVMTSHRAIMLEAVTARIFSRAWRLKIVQGLEAIACPMQYGGRSGLSIEGLHLHVKLAMQNAAHQRQSHAAIFVDIRSAFYSIAKPLLAGHHNDIEHIRKIFDVMNLPEEVWSQFLYNVQDADLVRQATQSNLVAENVASNLDQTWFVVPDASETCAPKTGSRPGDPMADVLFAMVMSRVIRRINSQAEIAGIPLLQSVPGGEVSNTVTWVDDLAISLQDAAENIVSKAIQLVAIVQEAILEHGLFLSYGAGKSAIMFSFHGPQSTKARQKFEAEHKHGVVVFTEYQGPVTIPVVTHYKHLGGHLTRNATVHPEIQVRLARTMAKLQPLRKILTNQALDVQRRRLLVRIMGLTVLTLHTGSWWRLTQTELAAWQAAVFRVYHSIHGRDETGQVVHKDYFELADEMQAPMPMELLYIQRLKLLFHLIKVGDAHMISAVLYNDDITREASWLKSVMQSLKWMQQQLGDEAVPPELFQLHDRQMWSHFKDASSELHKLLRKVEKAHLLRIRTFLALRNHAEAQTKIFREMGHTLRDDSIMQSAEQKTFSCDECDLTFTCSASLAVHQQRKHGQRVAVRRLVADGVCRACGKQFHTRPRLIHHLQHGQTSCWVFHFRKFSPMTVDQAANLDEKDRHAGTVLHRRGFQDAEHQQLWRWATEVEMQTQLHCCVDGEVPHDDPTEEELAVWKQYGLLPPGKGGREKTLRNQGELHIHNVAHEVVQLETTLMAQEAPRPLRDAERPWGVDHRALREVEQLTIGNLLMVRALYLLLLVYFHGGSVTLEHPAEIAEKSQKWTIWDSAFVHLFLTLKEVYKVRFLQGPLGRPFCKPTNLLVGRINNMHQIIYGKYDRMWKQSETLGGFGRKIKWSMEDVVG